MIASFDEAFDRERAAWRAGNGGDDRGWPVEGEEGQRLRHAWEDAEAKLAEVWDRWSRLLHPRPLSDIGWGLAFVVLAPGQQLGEHGAAARDRRDRELFVLTSAERVFKKHAFTLAPTGRLKYPELVFSVPTIRRAERFGKAGRSAVDPVQ